MSKQLFELGRESTFVADPTRDLCIMGGKGVLPKDESGPLDTEATPDMSIRDMRRLKKALPANMFYSVKLHGVKTPITIAKINDLPVVVVGKRRVRALRKANYERVQGGMNPMDLPTVRCVVQRNTEKTALMESVVTENSIRDDDDLEDKIQKAVDMLEAGISPDRVCVNFGVERVTLDGWLKFFDNATDATKAAVQEGRLGASAAAEVAMVVDPTEQNALLEKLLTAPTVKAKSARAAKALRRGKQGAKTCTDRRSQQLFFEHFQKIELPKNASPRTVGFHEGVEEACKLFLGEKKVDERLVKVLLKARES